MIKPHLTGMVTSTDGTQIGDRQLGKGADLVVSHGTMLLSHNDGHFAHALPPPMRQPLGRRA